MSEEPAKEDKKTEQERSLEVVAVSNINYFHTFPQHVYVYKDGKTAQYTLKEY